MTHQCKPIGFFEVSHGLCNAMLVGCREIFIRALLCGAVYIVVLHNHPSGKVKPYREDINIAKRIKDASELLGIKLCDHIIVGREGYYSFVDADIL